MKIRPVILCGGSGTRLWPNSKAHQAKQFIDFGGWTLFGKTLERIKGSLFDTPIISTNSKYLKEIKNHLKENKIKTFFMDINLPIKNIRNFDAKLHRINIKNSIIHWKKSHNYPF